MVRLQDKEGHVDHASYRKTVFTKAHMVVVGEEIVDRSRSSVRGSSQEPFAAAVYTTVGPDYRGVRGAFASSNAGVKPKTSYSFLSYCMQSKFPVVPHSFVI